MELLAQLNQIKPVWVELGLQTMHEDTALDIRRGYPLSVFEDAVNRLRAAGLEVIVHTILGLPGEDQERMFETLHYLNDQDIKAPASAYFERDRPGSPLRGRPVPRIYYGGICEADPRLCRDLTP